MRVSIYLVCRTYRNYYAVKQGDFVVRFNNLAYKVINMIDIDRCKMELDLNQPIVMSNVNSRFAYSKEATIVNQSDEGIMELSEA